MGSASGQSKPRQLRLTDRVSIGVLTRVIDRDIVDEILASTGKREQRVRRLPAHVVVYFVIAMGIFRDGYEEILRKLVGGLRFLGSWRDHWVVPTTGAVSQARERLYEAPMKELFTRLAVPLARPGAIGAWLRSWRLMAIDGVQIDVPDTPENLEAFGKYRDGTRRPFPQVRIVGLGEAGTHAVLAARIGTIYDGERELAADLLPAIEPDMLVLADRGFFSFELWQQYLVTGAALLWRLTRRSSWTSPRCSPMAPTCRSSPPSEPAAAASKYRCRRYPTHAMQHTSRCASSSTR
jgi:hypothetical protein